MRHAAEKFIDGAKPGHGANFRKWAAMCNAMTVDPVGRCTDAR
jgi:hypothetical protein